MADAFYGRFNPPVVSQDAEVYPDKVIDKLIVGDSRHMAEVPSASAALVVTSPPYFAGKEYEQALGQGGVPGSYLAYLQMLREVFAECARTLEPGGRIAVNVANLGRRPYRSLSADIIGVLQDDLGLLLRGEIVWVKQRGSSGSCAWGSFQQAGNPVLRDLSERVIVASKGRFDRALSAAQRARQGLPHVSDMTREDFMEGTLDLWEIAPESATRVGHPAPFPVELPSRLVQLYTYAGDLVVDPFVGSGTTAVAAVRLGRHYAGYDMDDGYIALAEARLAAEPARWRAPGPHTGALDDGGEAEWARAVRQGRAAPDVARALLEAAGFSRLDHDVRLPGGVTVGFTAVDGAGCLWLFDVPGSLTTHRPGLKRSEVLWKALGKAAVVAQAAAGPLVLLTAGMPTGAGAAALSQVTGRGKPVHAVVDMLAPDALAQVLALATPGA